MNIFRSIFNRGPGITTASPGGNQITRVSGATQLPAPTAEMTPGGNQIERRAGNPNAVQPAPDLPVSQKNVTKDPFESGFYAVPVNVKSALIKIAGAGLVHPDELEEFRKAQIEYLHCDKFQMSHLDKDADQAWLKQQREIETLVAAGKRDELPENTWTREEWRTDFTLKRKATRNRARQLCQSLMPIRLKIAARLGAVAGKCADEIEANEKKVSETWGFEFRPSHLLRTLRFIEAHPENLVEHVGACPPEKLLEFAGIKIKPQE